MRSAWAFVLPISERLSSAAFVVSIVSFALSLFLISGRSDDDRRSRDTGR